MDIGGLNVHLDDVSPVHLRYNGIISPAASDQIVGSQVVTGENCPNAAQIYYLTLLWRYHGDIHYILLHYDATVTIIR